MRSLLDPALNVLTPAHHAFVTGPRFFSGIIGAPFHDGLTIVFSFALGMCAVAALASWLRGAKAGAPEIAVLTPTGVAPAGVGPMGRFASVARERFARTSVGTGSDGHPPRVVTISGSFGAAPSEVGHAVAARLGIPFVDRAVPLRVASTLGVTTDGAVAHDEHVQGTVARSLSNIIGIPVSFGSTGLITRPTDDEDAFRQATEKVLWDVASDRGGVILGRAGAIVLHDFPGALHERLDGPEERRVQRTVEVLGIDEDSAKNQVERTDGSHRLYEAPLRA